MPYNLEIPGLMPERELKILKRLAPLDIPRPILLIITLYWPVRTV
ncbi:hypothetical protein EDF58_11343 [Novosphingobium sp. PhB57]|jgi:hypothetical protein|nr:hypothetical protein EDF58_11343 [Novosphingobium sp. PhB57]